MRGRWRAIRGLWRCIWGRVERGETEIVRSIAGLEGKLMERIHREGGDTAPPHHMHLKFTGPDSDHPLNVSYRIDLKYVFCFLQQ